MKEQERSSLVSDNFLEIDSMESVLTPGIIAKPYPFIAVCDLKEVISRISPTFSNDIKINTFQRRLLQLQKEYAPDNSTFYYIQQNYLGKQIEVQLKRKMANELSYNRRLGIINFDQYLLLNWSQDNLYRLNLSRGADGTQISRPGSKVSREQQLQSLIEWLTQTKYDSLVLVDDVVAFATTFPPIINLIRQVLPNIQIQVLSGICSTQGEWAGQEKLQSLDIEVEAIIFAQASLPIIDGSSGMAIPDSRDSTIFGGKIGRSVDGRSLSFPYFYPFSQPTTSLMTKEKNRESSAKWIDYNLDLIKYLEMSLGKILRIEDLELAGFGVPYSSISEIQSQIDIPTRKESINKYLQQMAEL